MHSTRASPGAPLLACIFCAWCRFGQVHRRVLRHRILSKFLTWPCGQERPAFALGVCHVLSMFVPLLLRSWTTTTLHDYKYLREGHMLTVCLAAWAGSTSVMKARRLMIPSVVSGTFGVASYALRPALAGPWTGMHVYWLFLLVASLFL